MYDKRLNKKKKETSTVLSRSGQCTSWMQI
jgi:hypothetical protein